MQHTSSYTFIHIHLHIIMHSLNFGIHMHIVYTVVTVAYVNYNQRTQSPFLLVDINLKDTQSYNGRLPTEI